MKIRIAALLACLCACSSPNPFIEKRETLDRAFADIEAARLAPATVGLEGLLATTGSDAKQFALQRFYATYLLAQAHMRASAGAPFLQDVPSTATNRSIGASDTTARRVSNVGHLVAATLYASLAQEWSERAKGAAPVEQGEPLLTPRVSAVDVGTALDNLKVCELVVRTQLGFVQDVKRDFDSSPQLRDDKSCNELMDRLGVYAGLRPWVHFAAFEYAKDRNEQAAFRFGVTALASQNTIDARRVASIMQWIDSRSPSIFRCPSCKAVANPRLRACSDDLTPLIDFIPVEARSGTAQ